ncbi:hypothetical protein F383_11497 [Gossypium arboreum]|uniref:Uncharacterized protein n=1 Tax=Gossypium arboreum TaxID=29729 RepID=A0A0B0PVY9_GOSAR|nr:hypothetical protein F383_11497 [Gossypium arboreum]
MDQSASLSSSPLPSLCVPFPPPLGCIYRFWNA